MNVQLSYELISPFLSQDDQVDQHTLGQFYSCRTNRDKGWACDEHKMATRTPKVMFYTTL